MSDHDALLAAICAEPDEDTPRLAFADWLDENDQPERAAFIRAQIELARTPAWEPFAVLCKWRRPDWYTGKPFRAALPAVDGTHLEWHADAFRRGFGSRLNVRHLVAWEELSAPLFGRAPIDTLRLWSAATLDDWRRFATSPFVPYLRELHFVASPIEPLFVLRNTPAALGVTDICFERASGAGMPVVIEELLQSPLGKAVRGLHFHMGYESLDDLIDALNSNDAKRLERLSLSTMGLTAEHVRRLCNSPLMETVNELDLRSNHLGRDGGMALARHLPPQLRTLNLSGTHLMGDGFEALARIFGHNLRKLDLSCSGLSPRATGRMSRSSELAGLRSLNLTRCLVSKRELRHITRAKFWANLVELDLRGNDIPPAAVRHLLDAPVPRELTALILDSDLVAADSRNELLKKYGEAVVFTAREGE